MVLIRNNTTNKIGMYRKPSNLNNTITYNSSVLYKYKCTAYNFYINKALEFCTRDYLQSELNKTIAIDNVFPSKCINKLIFHIRH